MVAPIRCATREELQSLLLDRCDHLEGHHWTEHIAQCSHCNTVLSEMAAPDDLWNESRQHFSSVEFSKDEKENESAPDEPFAKFLLAHYLVEGIVGYGGMATVYRGFDPQLHRAVAIKVLHPHLAKTGNSRQRFLREAQSAASITHPNVIPIFGVHQEEGKTFLVMPLIANGSLQHRIDQDGPLCLEDTLRIGLQIAEALAAAHANGVIHRDVKPANILLEDGDKRVVLSDFGLARTLDDASITASGLIAGTPAYMSPEQARGEQVDHRTDLFSLGSVLYAMCTGHSPFQASSTLKLLREVSDASFQSVHRYQEHLPIWLDALIARFTASDPGKRVANATLGAELLRGCLLHATNPNQSLPTELNQHKLRTPSLWRTISLRSTIVMITMVSLCGLIGGVVFYQNSLTRRTGTPIEVSSANDNSMVQQSRFSHPWSDPLESEIKQISKDIDQFLSRSQISLSLPTNLNDGELPNDDKQ
jgi:serine/threonine-protein kinase